MSANLLHFESRELSIEERMAAGKVLRKNYPRVQRGDYEVSPDLADPVSI